MDFWEIIDKGIDYGERRMYDYRDKYYNQALSMRPDAEYLIDILLNTSNFNTMFSCTLEEDTPTIFNSYFTTVSNTVKAYRNGDLGKDISDYILTKLLDLKAMFLKSVRSHLWILTGKNEYSQKTLAIYNDFIQYLQINKDKLVSAFKDFGQTFGTELTAHDIDLITAWCYVIILNDYQDTDEVDNGYTARTDGIRYDNTFSSATTRIERDIHSVTYRMPRLLWLYADEEEYRKEYIQDFKIILKKCGISEKSVVKFQKDFQKKVFEYDKDNYSQYLEFDPFVNENILGNKRPYSDCLIYFIPVVGPVYFIYQAFRGIFKELLQYAKIIFDAFK